MKIAVIPARGGSKRIPRKNIRAFAGRPIIAYPIQASLESGLFDEVIVSTDDDEIASTALSYGAQVPFVRPKALSDDHTGTNAVVKHALDWYAGNGQTVEFACCIYATAPFLQVRHLKQGLEKLQAGDKQFSFSITSFPFPVQRALCVRKDGCVSAMYPEFTLTRSQDLPEGFHDAGQFYWGRNQAYRRELPLYAEHSVGVIIPRYLVQDIDTLEDWIRAEHMYRALQLSGEVAT
jgi:pseudaminic acid cytidylyltransferase